MGPRTEYRIYPSIGIARVGDSTNGFLIGPEAPGVVPAGPFRGNDKGIKPQAARFRIYKVNIDDNENETVLEEVVAGDNTRIEWSVNLANRKAAGSRIIDTLARSQHPQDRNKGLDAARCTRLISAVMARGCAPIRSSSPSLGLASEVTNLVMADFDIAD